MNWAKEAGHLVIASDEEALPLVDPLKNVTLEAISLSDKFLVDTEAHKAMLVGQFNAAEKFFVTGSARLEAIRSAETPIIPGRPYILFNTGFGVINSLWGSPQTALAIMRQAIQLTEEEAQSIIDVENASIDIVLQLIRWLAPDHRVVIRPHPSERAQMWREMFPQVDVVESSLPLPWIKSAKVLIHCNSTTGLEAAFVGTPTLNLNPIPAYGAQYIIGKINRTVETVQAAKKELTAFLHDETDLSGSISPDELFTPNGARNTARAILELIGEGTSLPNDFPWAPVARDPHQRVKFSASREEIVRSPSLSSAPYTAIHELDDSVFLLVPT
tara:strand:+ start:558 stop:1547 length:990 start_codon:yes stop_codon:yes gene_type:complete